MARKQTSVARYQVCVSNLSKPKDKVVRYCSTKAVARSIAAEMNRIEMWRHRGEDVRKIPLYYAARVRDIGAKHPPLREP